MKEALTRAPLPTMLWDGAVLIAYDLPKPDTIYRWTPKRKELFVKAIRHGLISREHFLVAYSVSERELVQWLDAIKNGANTQPQVAKLRLPAAIWSLSRQHEA